MSKILNKKAQIGTTMTLGLATLTIILILTIFIIISSFMPKRMAESTERKGIDMAGREAAMTSLLAYLQTPVNIIIDEKEQEIVISDLIRLATLNNDYEKILQEKSKEILDPVYKGKYALHTPQLKIVSIIGRPSFIYTLIPSEEPIMVMLGFIED